jgi:hypothetical protein
MITAADADSIRATNGPHLDGDDIPLCVPEAEIFGNAARLARRTSVVLSIIVTEARRQPYEIDFSDPQMHCRARPRSTVQPATAFQSRARYRRTTT